MTVYCWDPTKVAHWAALMAEKRGDERVALWVASKEEKWAVATVVGLVVDWVD